METVRKEKVWQSADTTLVITPLPVTAAAASLLTESDRRHIASLTCDKRRSEQTAWRSIVRRFEIFPSPIRLPGHRIYKAAARR